MAYSNSMKHMKMSEPEISKKIFRQSNLRELNLKELKSNDIEQYGLLKHFMAGGAAGFLSRTTTAPFDRLKVFLQVHSNHNVTSAFRYLYKEGGAFSFWRGNGINVFKIAPESAFKFMAYEEIKRILKQSSGHQQLNMFDRFIAGGLAGAFAQTIIYPLEVLKTRLVLRKSGESSGFRGFIFFTKSIYAKGGIASFYKGFLPNFIGILPYAGIDLTVYETTKNWLIHSHSNKTEPDVWMIIVCGISSSTIAQLFTYPLALVRTRLQAQAIMPTSNQPSTMCGQFCHIYKNDGFMRGFYRGFIPNFMKVMPAVSISYLTYEECRRYLGAEMS